MSRLASHGYSVCAKEGSNVLSAEQARDILMFATAELYPAFVDRARWMPQDYADLLYRFLRSALLA